MRTKGNLKGLPAKWFITDLYGAIYLAPHAVPALPAPPAPPAPPALPALPAPVYWRRTQQLRLRKYRKELAIANGKWEMKNGAKVMGAYSVG